MAYFMAGRYEDSLRIIDKQPIDNRTRYSWAIRASNYAALGQREKANAATKDALAALIHERSDFGIGVAGA